MDLLQQRQRGGHQQGRAAALDETEHREREGVPGDDAAQGRPREHRHPEAEHAAVPPAVPQRSTEQQQARERDRVAVHDPLQVRQRRGELAPDRGRRHVHDGHVEDDHEVAGTDRQQRRQRDPGTRLGRVTHGAPARRHIGIIHERADHGCWQAGQLARPVGGCSAVRPRSSQTLAFADATRGASVNAGGGAGVRRPGSGASSRTPARVPERACLPPSPRPSSPAASRPS